VPATLSADRKRHENALRWAQREFGAVLIWGIEDSRHLSARLEIDLLLALRQMMHNVPAAAL
jgi:transposase